MTRQRKRGTRARTDDDTNRLQQERTAAIELLAAARGCSIGEAHQLVLSHTDAQEHAFARDTARRKKAA